MLVQERKIACASFPPRLDDVVRDDLLIVQEGKLARASYDGMMFEMCSCLFKMEI